ncbi:MAG TPA: PaaI family thioesterase [Candidatus Binataceae bacterium]|nr:PaaI family thioesterase [Candidatus Binataceae bacterium]
MNPVSHLNLIIRENRVADYLSPTREIGMRPEEFGSGNSRWSWREQPPLVLNPFGAINGGFVAVFIDELLATAIGSVLEEHEWAMTAETKVSYLRPLRPGAISGTAQVVRRGQGIAFLDAEVLGPDAKVAARATSTWSISR